MSDRITPFNLGIDNTGLDRLFVHPSNIANVRLVSKPVAARWKPCLKSPWPLTECVYSEYMEEQGDCVNCLGRTDEELIDSLAFAPNLMNAHDLVRAIQSKKLRTMAAPLADEWALIRSARAHCDKNSLQWNFDGGEESLKVLFTIDPNEIFDPVNYPGLCMAKIVNVQCDNKEQLHPNFRFGKNYDWSKKVQHVTVASDKIDAGAFIDCESIVSIAIPMVKIIHDNAFSGCNNLTYVSKSRILSLGVFCFQDCEKLVTTLMPHVQSIGEGCFESCKSITSLNFPVLKTVGFSAFASCMSVTSVSIPCVETIESSCFAYCSSIDTMWLPSVKLIKSEAFLECNELVEVWIPTVSAIESFAFDRCYKIKGIFVSNQATAKMIASKCHDLHNNIMIGTPPVSIPMQIQVDKPPYYSDHVFTNKRKHF
jgi:hypothetical protein